MSVLVPEENELFLPEDFLPKPQLDPWNAYSALEHDAIIVVEFCEVVGPRPVVVVPASPGAHFDADALALWLMTADYHLSNGNGGPFSVADDIAVLLHNEEQGIQAYAVHFMLYELAARGFHRPYAVAYLTRESALLPRLLPKLASALSNVVAALRRCNRKLFLREIAQALDTLDSVETQAVATYYELYYDNNQPTTRSRAERIHLKTRKMHRDLELTHAALSKAIHGDKESGDFPHCGNHKISIEEWTGKMLETRDPAKPLSLKSFNGLAPCLHQEAANELRHIWCRFRRANPAEALLPFDPWLDGPSINLHGRPLLRIPPPPDYKSPPPEEEEEVRGELREEGKGAESHLLANLLPTLPSLLAPILSGQFLLLAGSDLRRPTLTTLLSKLRHFIPTAGGSSEGSGGLVRRWHEGRVPATAFADFKLFGLQLGSSDSLEDQIAVNILPFLSILNLNSDTLTATRYKGRVLGPLGSKSPELFPSDAVLGAYVRTRLSDYAHLAYVLYHAVYADHNLYRRNIRKLGAFKDRLRLDSADLRVVRYLVELLKAQQTDAARLEGAFESLFLEHEPHSLIKL